jgi:hypothetical protein
LVGVSRTAGVEAIHISGHTSRPKRAGIPSPDAPPRMAARRYSPKGLGPAHHAQAHRRHPTMAVGDAVKDLSVLARREDDSAPQDPSRTPAWSLPKLPN